MRFSLASTILAFITYIVFTGSATLYDIFTGIIVSIAIGFIIGGFVVKDEKKAFNPVRWFWAIVYFLKYIIVIEAKAHLNVIKLLFTGKYEPGIVKVPLDAESGYAKVLVANSITNTPGTVVVDIDDKYLYVNWINVLTEDPMKAKEYISLEFEKYAKKIFD
ncbi:MAG: cation:proton antiporter [Desulfurococcales archaeon ex4484_58]|nr:MAG: cation:proton antiporter [Desulfurococcales archaeon ex4484_58]